MEFEHASQPGAEPLVAWGGQPRAAPPPPAPVEYELTIVVVNDGETTEYVRNLWIENAAGTEGFDVTGEPGDESGDRPLPPRGRVSARIRPSRIGLDLSAGFYGVARLASGRLVQSPVDHLMPSLLEHIEEWNRSPGR